MLLLLLSITSSTFADSATWKTNPGSGDWNTASNWTPAAVPNDPADTATFALSNTTGISLSAVTVNGVVFNAGASAFTISVRSRTELTISGVGITNNSGITQNFVTTADQAGFSGEIHFFNNATAGNLTSFTNNSGSIGGVTFFFNTSSAGTSLFTNEDGGLNGANSGVTQFFDMSTAANGTFINNGGTSDGAGGGATVFLRTATAGNGTFTNKGGMVGGAYGGATIFEDTSTAGSATLIANGGTGGGGGGLIYFFYKTTGGTARLELFGNGFLDISGHNAPGVATGSIEGTGNVFLGDRNLTVGSNNLSTNFSGVIQDGGIIGGIGGSLTKIGTGKLALSHRNTYTGGTTIKRGKLIINNLGGSGTGSGPVQVNGGRLGGKGTIAGAVTVGTGTGRGAVLSPGYLNGVDSPGALSIQSALTFNSDATYEVEVNSSSATADEVIANGVTINTGAQFSFADLGSGTLIPGTVFTVINNTAATPIAGTFSNLLDGSMFTANGNTYQVNYDGGDGNDLTLAVIP
jgi:autotransporter-associated beta strand protein